MAYLGRSFFERAPDEVAHDLIGAHMVVRDDDALTTVRIVETEAYGGDDDPASHAYRGRSARNAAMFGPPGHLYVYLIYGVHWCMNVVTQEEGVASAVLLRGADLIDGACAHSPPHPPASLRGPGRLSKYLGVSGDDDGLDCCAPRARVRFSAPPTRDHDVRTSPRIGISRARERVSRYYLESGGGRARARSLPARGDEGGSRGVG